MTERKHNEDDSFELELDNKPDSAAGPAGAADSPAADSAIPEQIQELQAEKDELRDTLVRRQADFDNYRKRIERERSEDNRRTSARIIENLLPVLDASERAVAAHDDPAYEDYRKGFELIYRQLSDALARQGLERIEAEGQRFDPHFHLAVERVESAGHADGTVLAQLQPGYVFHGKVLRPASVRVAVHPSEPADDSEKARRRAN